MRLPIGQADVLLVNLRHFPKYEVVLALDGLKGIGSVPMA
jgi:hypothetical protein